VRIGAILASAEDVAYGSGFYVSHVLGGKRYARPRVSDGKGTQLNVEFHKASNTEHDPFSGWRRISRATFSK
jgi:hypothetical protein